MIILKEIAAILLELTALAAFAIVLIGLAAYHEGILQ